MGQIQYSEKYFDDTYEYRHVVLPPEVAKLLPKNRLLSETNQRQLSTHFLLIIRPQIICWAIKAILMSRNAIVATGLLAFASAGLAFPFYIASRSSRTPVIDSSKPLPPQATFRGPYINTGSRDVGPDHQTYTKK
ncbi:unnamed protein product [Fraxinus pennsylvanica]|uniref:Cyclin-dependent kinases regulatory subunit n=1 Tax=Fraxinus pennsylvanica TaxID=56036 RepID=A0AAD2ECU5_9LAMI|nr:unnamed protein product [Fraxinus pennsylvanica]